jgi:hypothetical protein
MKRILAILSLLLFITSCDDGNLTVDVIDFSEGPIQKCNLKDIIYKVKGSEMMFIEIPSTYFTNDQTLGTATIIPLSNTLKVIYRRYASETSNLNICPQAPDATPNLTEQWQATEGTIELTSTAVKTTNATTGFTKITGYNYYIVLKNVTFEKPSGPQVYETFVFGNYNTTISPLAFGFDADADKSTCDNRIFNFNGSEAILFDTANFSTLFENTATTTPRTALISAANKLTYKLFDNTVNDAYFCATITPATPLLTQEWNALNGVEATSGIIEVTTTTLGTSFRHTIHLKRVTLKKGNSDFSLGDDYIFGSFITTP